MLDKIVIRGAREHNLKNIDIDIPHGQLTVISGVSGSGKSSLAFDTLYAEGQRRYIESLTTYAKQFLERIARPDVDEVSGISPSIAIQQKNTTRSSRSTVGTTTEIYDYLRLLFARVGRTFCPDCKIEVLRYEPEEAVAALIKRHKGRRFLVVADVEVRTTVDALIERLIKDGYARILIGDEVCKLDEIPKRRVSRRKKLRVIVDRVVAESSKRTRIAEGVEAAYRLAEGFVRFRAEDDGTEETFTSHSICADCEREFEEPRPILFSFNTPYGACPECRGFGNRMEFDDALIVPDRTRSLREYAIEPWSSEKFDYFYNELMQFCRRAKISTTKRFMDLGESARRRVMEGEGNYVGVLPFLEELRGKSYKKYARFFTRRYMTFRGCRHCDGGRLRPEAFFVRLAGKNIRDVASMVPGDALKFVESIKLTKREQTIAKDILLELRSRLKFMLDVGLYYVTLDRLTRTLSGGEAQRINLANSLGANLIGVLYVLDEPSVGLHPRDTENLVQVLTELRNRGNTVVVVEHDLDIIREADYLVDLGPGAGRYGGELTYQGTLADAKNGRSRTIKYVREGLPLHGSTSRRKSEEAITVTGVTEHNLKNIDASFPKNAFTAVTGVSGSGKSTLVCDVLHAALRNPSARSGAYRKIDGAQNLNKIMLVDQSPIGKTPRSNPTTYIKAFAMIRDIFAATKESRKRGYSSGRFSFNVPGGRCVRCEGMGYERIEMHFMADMFVCCPDCDGKRFNAETLEVKFKDKDLADILDLTVSEALTFFNAHKLLVRRLQSLEAVGLGYLKLGQPSTTLSGGESQRIKIARELSESTDGGAVYLLDEPTTGLHIDDVDILVRVLRELIDKGNTVIVVEHNPQVILQADHIIDLGPGGGDDGGQIVAAGTPPQIIKVTKSHTGAYLRKLQRSSRKGAA
jgi:excinuclease ABC subunit A